VIVVKDFGDNLEAALKEFRRTAAANMAEARRRQAFMPEPTRYARKRRGKRLEKRRIALGLERRF
jgi:ribosomal protein S21